MINPLWHFGMDRVTIYSARLPQGTLARSHFLAVGLC